LYGFFEWAATECPAEHYLLIFWGHSRAQFGMFGDSDRFEYTAQTLTLDELSEALRAAKRSLEKPVDVIAFKDCFMANLETAYELSGLADYLLVSSGLVPVVGWPYDEMFQALTAGDQAPIEKAKLLLGTLEAHYQVPKNLGQQAEVPYSLLSTRGAVAAVDRLGDLFGRGRNQGIALDHAALRPKLDEAAKKSGDAALVDLGVLLPAA
jgi:hypothetical protein